MWIGSIIPKTTGTYTFRMDSNDDSKIFIGNHEQLNKDDLNSGYLVRINRGTNGTISLTANISYDIIIPYGENTSGQSITFRWKYPGNNSWQYRLDNENLRFIYYT